MGPCLVRGRGPLDLLDTTGLSENPGILKQHPTPPAWMALVEG